VKVTGNRFNRNGASVTGVVSRSGMFARGYDSDDNGDPVGNSANLGGVFVASNVAISNHDLGFDVLGVVDGGSNRASLNTNPLQCVGLRCGSAVAQSHALLATASSPNTYANVAHHTAPDR
jgi:hypothetical protein